MAHQVVLTWALPDDATAVSTYNVYRAAGLCPATGLGTATYTKLNAVPITGLTYTDTTVKVGGQYCYYGTQVQNGIESVPSNTGGGTVTPHTIIIQLVVS